MDHFELRTSLPIQLTSLTSTSKKETQREGAEEGGGERGEDGCEQRGGCGGAQLQEAVPRLMRGFGMRG